MSTDGDIYAMFLQLLAKYKKDVYKGVWDFIDERFLFKMIWEHLIIINAMITVVPPAGAYINTSDYGKIYTFLKENNYYEQTSWQIFSKIINDIGNTVFSLDPRDSKISSVINNSITTLIGSDYKIAKIALKSIIFK